MRETQLEVAKKLDIRQRRLLAYQTTWVPRTAGTGNRLCRDWDLGEDLEDFLGFLPSNWISAGLTPLGNSKIGGRWTLDAWLESGGGFNPS